VALALRLGRRPLVRPEEPAIPDRAAHPGSRRCQRVEGVEILARFAAPGAAKRAKKIGAPGVPDHFDRPAMALTVAARITAPKR
jgi:hypothetical protein